MKQRILGIVLAFTASFTAALGQSNTYGLPADIQDGNILHCFNWTINDVRNDLQQIAEAGFGAVQLSPLQRRNVSASAIWYDLYRPYDYAFQETNNVMGTSADLTALCTEAHSYGIKVIVDVVANHVDKAAGYYDPWWRESTSRYRSWGGTPNINYNSRQSITRDRLGDYVEINTENSEVTARAKAYIQWLKDHGVDGCRWDAAKHIGLPSEGGNFWSEVTSVAGMWHYGEILGTPGAPSDNNTKLIQEYAKYMSVTDSRYSDNAAENNSGMQLRKNGEWAPAVGANKTVLWGETHDTFANTPDYGGWSNNKSQETVDRAYAAVACRDGAAALYLSRPTTTVTGNMRIRKGSDHYQSASVSEVNKFRNKMTGRSEFFCANGDGSAVSITRNNGGAVVITKGSGNFTVENGGGLCPEGTYIDRVTGSNTIIVTGTTISGTSGTSGIVVIYNDELDEPFAGAPVQDYDDGSITIYYDNSETRYTAPVYCYFWGSGSSKGWPGEAMTHIDGDIYSYKLSAGANAIFTQANGSAQTVDVNKVQDGHLYKGLLTKTGGKNNCTDMGKYTPNAGIGDVADDHAVTYEYYNLQGVRVGDATASPGIYIRRGSDGSAVRIIKR